MDWLCEEVAAIVAEGFELGFLGIDACEPLDIMQFKRCMSAPGSRSAHLVVSSAIILGVFHLQVRGDLWIKLLGGLQLRELTKPLEIRLLLNCVELTQP